MFQNYIKTAWRNLTRHKLFSFINIFGLASGMTVCMLALIKIKDAYDYDTFHPHPERSYRITTNLHRKNGEQFPCASSPLALGSLLKNNYKVIEKCSSLYFSRDEVTANHRKLHAKELYTDPDFYAIFGFTLLSGYPATSPQTVVLTEETAERFFGKENPIGHTITIGNSDDFIVTGILNKPPFSSHLTFDLLASMPATLLKEKDHLGEVWTNEAAAYTYIQLKAGVPAATLKNILKHVTRQVNALLPPSTGKSFVFDAQRLDKISPGTTRMYNITDEPIAPNLVAFALIGLLVLSLAFFNYINLTLSRSLDRAREVGIRKVAGARKQHLMMQFLSESVLTAVLAFVLAHFLYQLLNTLPAVQRIIGNASQDKTLWTYFIVFTLLTGLIAGWVPARVLSAFQPVRVLKGKFNTKLFGGVGLRKTLTVVQFAASLIAIVTLLVFYRQSIYMATADYGFNQQRMLNIELPGQSYETAANTFSSTPGIEEVSGTSGLFGFSSGDIKFIRRDKTSDSLHAVYFSVTPSYAKNMGMQLLAGENLPDFVRRKETSFVLINEEACRQLQFKDISEAAGKRIWLNDSTTYIISGVVKNFHYTSFLHPIQPLLLGNQPDKIKILNLKVAKGAEHVIVPLLKKTWEKLYPHQPFEAQWFDKQLHDQHLHKDDLMFIGVLTLMGLSIACLGLLGMVTYATRNRLKEVSIRRVMGAGVGQVMVTVSREFIRLLLLSVCIGLPVGYFAGNEFLQQYAYRISLGFGILAVSAATLLFLGGLTIGWQSYRAALTNPVKSLRME